MDDNLLIQLNGLPDGSKRYHWDLGKEFFASFGNSEILEAAVSVGVKLEKSGDYIGLDIDLDGKVTVPCDRCLAPLELEVRDTFYLSVKFGSGDFIKDEEAQPAGDGGDFREIVWLPEDAEGIDIRQDVYDYTYLNLPSRKVHDEGYCDPDVVRYLGRDKATVSGNNPFESLKDVLLKDLGL
ncbi:MAG: DUF177 domain-containing protein [Bacteroidales bacterium]|nr:DUF177 domain-containing protein [Bacteroidales bacterium]